MHSRTLSFAGPVCLVVMIAARAPITSSHAEGGEAAPPKPCQKLPEVTQCGNRTKCECNEGLFVNEQRIELMVNTRLVTDSFRIKEVTKKFLFSGVCESLIKELNLFGLEQLPTCPHSKTRLWSNPSQEKSGGARAWPWSCCKTEMSFVVPITVQSIFSVSTSLTVVHEPPSYQLIHQGTCESLGSRCGGHGTCQVEERLHWMMVGLGSSQEFVPVLIPNHCFCQYT